MFDLFGMETEVDKKYTTKVNIPQYLPKADAPTNTYPLFDTLFSFHLKIGYIFHF